MTTADAISDVNKTHFIFIQSGNREKLTVWKRQILDLSQTSGGCFGRAGFVTASGARAVPARRSSELVGRSLFFRWGNAYGRAAGRDGPRSVNLNALGGPAN